MTKVPENLISQALKTPEISTAVVCAEQEILLESIKEATEKKFIKPILIGNQEIIHQIAKKINFNIQNVKIINEKSNIECSVLACKLAKENKIKIIVKGNLHTDILMRVYLKKKIWIDRGKKIKSYLAYEW